AVAVTSAPLRMGGLYAVAPGVDFPAALVAGLRARFAGHPPEALARHRPEGGESFLDMAARVQPLLDGLREDTLIVGHAGTVRAALALVVGAQALSFSVAPLSLTILRRAGDDWAVEAVNITGPL
ncbi:MAG: histidine phosphatase family protein, partial [Pararhodobacter sp.]